MTVNKKSARARLSVAMCTYNGVRYLSEQLESLAAQSRLPDELVVCDDHSTDETVGILEGFASGSPFPVRLFVNAQTLGVIKNFEQAIRLCSGEIISLADQDDVWFAHKLQHLEAVLESAPGVGLVFSDAELVDDSLNPLNQKLSTFKFKAKDQREVRAGRAVEVIIARNNVVTGATLAFRSKFKELALPFPTDTNFIHDGWLALIIASAAKIQFIPEPLIQYRQHAAQQIGVQDARGQQLAHTGPNSRVQALENMANFYRKQIELHHEVRRRLLAVSDEEYQTNIAAVEARIAELQKHVSHFQARAQIAQRRIDRVPMLVRELCALRYHRYSNGFYSFAKDVFLGGMS